MRKNVFRTIICFIICIVTAVAFCACSPKAPDNSDPDKNKWWTTEGELEKDADGKVVFKNVSVKLETVVAGDDKDAFNMLVQKFNREYNGKIRVNVTNTGQGEYERDVAAKITQNSNAPDLIMSHQKSHKNFADNKLIQPLNEAMEKSGIKIEAKDYADGLAKYMSAGYDDYTFSVPVDCQSLVVFYNKKLLASLNMQLPTNRKELFAVCKAFKDKYNGSAIAWATGENYFTNYVYLSAILQNGASLYDENTYLATWYDDETNRNAIRNASESFRELFKLAYATFAEGKSSALTGFMGGNRLFYVVEPWDMSNLVYSFATSQNVSETELMRDTLGGTSFEGWFAMEDTDKPYKNHIYGDSHFFAMSKTVTDINKKAAILEFIKWFTSRADVGVEWAKAGHISASKIISADPEYSQSDYVANFIGKFYPDIDNFCCIGSTPHYAAIVDNLKAIFADTVDRSDNHTEESDFSTIRQKQEAANNSISFFG